MHVLNIVLVCLNHTVKDWFMIYSRVSQLLYLAQNVTLQSERYTTEFFVYVKLGYWFIQILLYSNAKLIAFWRNACILHNTGLEFAKQL